MKESCIFYRDWFDALQKYPPEIRMELYDSIIDYGLNGETHSQLSDVSSLIFEAFRPKLSRDFSRYNQMCEKNKSNGEKGGRPKKETQKNHWVIEKPKKTTGLLKNPKNHDNDNDKDNEKEIIIEDKSSLSKSDADFCVIKDFFNIQVKDKAIPRITSIRGQRLNSVRARLKENGEENIRKAIINASQSEFLNGKNKNAFIATFDWIFKPNNFPKVLEGNYNERRKDNTGDNNNNKAYRVGFDLQEQLFNRMEQEEARTY